MQQAAHHLDVPLPPLRPTTSSSTSASRERRVGGPCRAGPAAHARAALLCRRAPGGADALLARAPHSRLLPTPHSLPPSALPGYKIPRGGAFQYVSAANYFGGACGGGGLLRADGRRAGSPARSAAPSRPLLTPTLSPSATEMLEWAGGRWRRGPRSPQPPLRCSPSATWRRAAGGITSGTKRSFPDTPAAAAPSSRFCGELVARPDPPSPTASALPCQPASQCVCCVRASVPYCTEERSWQSVRAGQGKAGETQRVWRGMGRTNRGWCAAGIEGGEEEGAMGMGQATNPAPAHGASPECPEQPGRPQQSRLSGQLTPHALSAAYLRWRRRARARRVWVAGRQGSAQGAAVASRRGRGGRAAARAPRTTMLAGGRQAALKCSRSHSHGINLGLVLLLQRRPLELERRGKQVCGRWWWRSVVVVVGEGGGGG